MLRSLLLVSTFVAVAGLGPNKSALGALDTFAASWSRVAAYSATLSIHETAGTGVQDRTYAYTFEKPATATIAIIKGPGRGGKMTWSGGDEVIASPPGLLSGLKLHLAISDSRVTTLRGDTIAMASFGWVLDHFRRTTGITTEAPGAAVDGVPTTVLTLTVADPPTDNGLTQETLILSDATQLPVLARRYVGSDLVKEIRYSAVTVRASALKE